MKKFLFTLLVMLLNVVASQAQNLKLGDYVVIDDVPSFVFYIDDSGRHGLVMSMPAIPAREAKKKDKYDKQVDKYLEEEWLSTSMAEKYKNGTLSCGGGLTGFTKWSTIEGSKFVGYNPTIPDGLKGNLGDDGKANQEAIINYCKENGISLAENFPYQSWATQLGEGWYIPGSNELELFAKFYFGGVGEEYKQTQTRDRSKQVSDDKRVQKALMGYITWIGIVSSSLQKESDKKTSALKKGLTGLLDKKTEEGGFRVLQRWQKGTGGKQFFEFTKDAKVFACCAVHEF